MPRNTQKILLITHFKSRYIISDILLVRLSSIFSERSAFTEHSKTPKDAQKLDVPKTRPGLFLPGSTHIPRARSEPAND